MSEVSSHNQQPGIGSVAYYDNLDYRMVLEEALRSRKARNPSYSLRAFARDIGLPPSRLTEIFQKKDGLSAKRAVIVASRLGLSPHETERFLALVDLQSGRSPMTRRLAQAKLASLSVSRASVLMREDCVAMLAGWHHFALLELSRIPGFRSDTAWIARRLKISVAETEQSVERLMRVGLLKRVRTKLVPTGQRFATTSDVPSAALRDYHASILRAAMGAIDEQPLSERELGASLFPVHTSQIPALKEDIRAARREIVRKYEYTGPTHINEAADAMSNGSVEVYCIAGQLFRVSQREDHHESGAFH